MTPIQTVLPGEEYWGVRLGEAARKLAAKWDARHGGGNE